MEKYINATIINLLVVFPMRTIDTRKVAVLKIIVENYLQTGDIIGSKALLRSYDLQVSSATVRNDMAALEKMGLVFQPYNSAGRLPTPRGIRVFVDYLMEHSPAMLLESGALSEENGIPARNHLDDTLYDVVSRLARISREIAFISLPHEGVYLVSGLAGFIERSLPDGVTAACTVVRLVEDRPTFRALLSQLPLMPNKV